MKPIFFEKIDQNSYCIAILPDSCFFLSKEQIQNKIDFIKKFKIISFGNLDFDELFFYDLKLLYDFSGYKVNNIIDLCESMNINCGLYEDLNLNIDFFECKEAIEKEKAVIKSCEIAKIDIGKFAYDNLFIDKEFLPKLYKSKALICQRFFERLDKKLLEGYKKNYFKLKDFWKIRSLQSERTVTPFIDGKKKIQQEFI